VRRWTGADKLPSPHITLAHIAERTYSSIHSTSPLPGLRCFTAGTNGRGRWVGPPPDPRSRFGQVRAQKYHLLMRELRTSFHGRVARILVTILTELPQLQIRTIPTPRSCDLHLSTRATCSLQCLSQCGCHRYFRRVNAVAEA
jgi:hypothetical protein